MVKVLRKLGFLFSGRLLKRLKRLCWKRSRRVKACVGSNPMSSVIRCKKRCLAFFLFVKRDESCFNMNIFLEILENNFSKKISKLLFILYNSVVKWD